MAGLIGDSAVVADQTDPRLDNLFNILQSSDEQLELRAAESLIWSTWNHHDNAEYRKLMRMGTRSMDAGQFDQAIGIFSSLIEKAPDFAEAWNKRATIYFMIGDYSLSVEDVDRTLALEPTALWRAERSWADRVAARQWRCSPERLRACA